MMYMILRFVLATLIALGLSIPLSAQSPTFLLLSGLDIGQPVVVNGTKMLLLYDKESGQGGILDIQNKCWNVRFWWSPRTPGDTDKIIHQIADNMFLLIPESGRAYIEYRPVSFWYEPIVTDDNGSGR